MAEGQSVSYSARANAAAATATTCGGVGCPSCVKSGLPVLLVRPGLADSRYTAGRKQYVEPLLKGVADPKLTAAGYIMRTLRKGYVYAYYEHQHTPELKQQKGWQVFQVDEGGYLTPVPLAAATQSPKAFQCKRDASYAIAMLFVIPDAANTKRVWVGFSDHPWSDAVRRKYAANEALRAKRMACIDAHAGKAARSMPLTTLNIEEGVADYKPDLAQVWPHALKGNPYQGFQATGAMGTLSWTSVSTPAGQSLGLLDDAPPKRRREGAADLVLEARKIIGADRSKRYADANLMIVSVPDPVGVTTEAAQRRLTLCNGAAAWLADQRPNYKLQSALQIEGMLKIIEQNGAAQKAQHAKVAGMQGRAVTRKQFDAMKASGALPPDATFVAGVVKRSQNPNHWYPDVNNGTVRIPSAKDIDHQTAGLKTEVLEKLQGGAKKPKHREFLNTYNKKVEEDRELLSRLEQDYKAWLLSDARKIVTQNDFDEHTQSDGVFYANCIAQITLGGPLTVQGQEWFKPFLSAEPANNEALLLRALLGNQKNFFEWFAELDQVSKSYDSMKTILDLDPVKTYAGSAARAAVQQLLTVTGAVAAGMDNAGALGENLRYKLKLLTMALMAKAESSPITLLRLQATLPEATRLWQTMVGEARGAISAAVRAGQNKVESLVLNTAVAIEMAGAPAAAMGTVDVYIMVREAPEKFAARMSSVAATAGTMVLRPAEIYGGKLATVAWRIASTEAPKLARSTMTVAREGGLLSAGALVLQALLIGKAWKDYEKGNADERMAASLSLLSAGMGVGAALVEISAGVARQLRREALEQSLRFTAGLIASGATVIDTVQAIINSRKAAADGDENSSLAFGVQAVLFGAAAVAGTAAAYAAVTGGSAALFGLSATGWGLILVALGVIVGFVVLLIKDKPPETWAAKTIWGQASNRWSSFDQEQAEANKVLLGTQIDFSYRLNLLENAGASMAMSGNAGLAAAIGGYEPPPITRDAWVRLKMPNKLRKSLAWDIAVYGTTSQGEILLHRVRNGGDVGTAVQAAKGRGFVVSHQFGEDAQDESATLTVKVNAMKVKTTRAEVCVFAGRTEPGADIRIVHEELRD